MQAIDTVFYVTILIMSVVIHEFAHGYVAYRFGDNTALLQGRLTLNPIKHLDIFGSILLPFILIITHAGFVVGWAKPVPYNPNNLRNKKWGTLAVACAGIIANLALALIFGLFLRFAFGHITLPVYKIISTTVLLNLLLALFNLIPIPPLDGSKILFTFLPYKYRYIENYLERWGMIVLLIFILTLWNQISPVIYTAFSFITGIPL